jgi:hypothetical protein
MIEPTVGRVVWFQPNDGDVLDQPLAAHVAYVHHSRSVNLMVIGHDGAPFPRLSVRLVQEGESPEVDEPFCEWMPYQLGQAKKNG